MTGGWQRWIFAGGGLVVGVGLGMLVGLLWARDHAGWVEAIGTVVAAITTSIAAVAAVLAFLHERKVRDQEVARLRSEVSERERTREEAELNDARNVVITCLPGSSGSRSASGKVMMNAFRASWNVGSSVPPVDVRIRVPPEIDDWQGLADVIPVPSTSEIRGFSLYGAYEIEGDMESQRDFTSRAVVRYTLGRQRWERVGSRDPVRVAKEPG